MVQKIKRTLLVAALCLSIAFAMERLFSFYYEKFPVALSGNCLSFHYQGKERIYKVLANRNFSSKSLLREITNQDLLTSGLRVMTYSELRDIDATKVDCND